MLISELEWLRDNVAKPAMQKLMDNTVIPDGMCCINHLEISFLDGRSYGNDSLIKASGYLYENGKVKPYSYEEYDVSVKEFAEAHKDCVFISDGKLQVYGGLEELEIKSVIRNLCFCGHMYPDLLNANTLHMEMNCPEFIKMQYLFYEQNQALQSMEEIKKDQPEPFSLIGKTFTFYPEDYADAIAAFRDFGEEFMEWSNGKYPCKLEEYPNGDIYYDLILPKGTIVMIGETIQIIGEDENNFKIYVPGDEHAYTSVDKSFFRKNFSMVPEKTLQNPSLANIIESANLRSADSSKKPNDRNRDLEK